MPALSLIDKIAKGLDNNIATARVVLLTFLGFACDTIDHHIVLNKLFPYGVRGIVHNWFRIFTIDAIMFILLIPLQLHIF